MTEREEEKDSGSVARSCEKSPVRLGTVLPDFFLLRLDRKLILKRCHQYKKKLRLTFFVKYFFRLTIVLCAWITPAWHQTTPPGNTGWKRKEWLDKTSPGSSFLRCVPPHLCGPRRGWLAHAVDFISDISVTLRWEREGEEGHER